MPNKTENPLAKEIESFEWLLKQAVHTDTQKQAELCFQLMTDALRSLGKIHSKMYQFDEGNKIARDCIMEMMSLIAEQIKKLVSFFGLEFISEATKESLSNFKVMSVSEIPEYLKVTKSHVWDFILWRKLPVFKINGCFYVVRGVLDAWAKGQRDEARKQNSTQKENQTNKKASASTEANQN